MEAVQQKASGYKSFTDVFVEVLVSVPGRGMLWELFQRCLSIPVQCLQTWHKQEFEGM